MGTMECQSSTMATPSPPKSPSRYVNHLSWPHPHHQNLLQGMSIIYYGHTLTTKISFKVCQSFIMATPSPPKSPSRYVNHLSWPHPHHQNLLQGMSIIYHGHTLTTKISFKVCQSSTMATPSPPKSLSRYVNHPHHQTRYVSHSSWPNPHHQNLLNGMSIIYHGHTLINITSLKIFQSSNHLPKSHPHYQNHQIINAVVIA